MNLDEFNTLELTEEDLQKGDMYASQRKRQELQDSSSDLSDFIRNLDMKVIFSKANSFTIPRIAQLISKTNQFNTTTQSI